MKKRVGIKLLAIFLSAVMLIGIFPVAAFGAEVKNMGDSTLASDLLEDQQEPFSGTVTAQGTFGTSQWTLYDDGLLELGAGELDEITGVHPWEDYRLDIVTIRLVGDVVANESCNMLFAFFENLETIENIDRLDTSNVTYTGYMFAFSAKLTSLDLSSWHLSNVLATTSMFMGCTALEYLDISGWNLSNVSQTSSMFMSNFEHPVGTLVLGENSVSMLAPVHDAYLPMIPITQKYTGNWVGLNTQTVFLQMILLQVIFWKYIKKTLSQTPMFGKQI